MAEQDRAVRADVPQLAELVPPHPPLLVSVHARHREELARQYLPKGHALWPGNRCALLHDGIEAFPAMLKAIAGAKTSVRLETYMFINDGVGELFAQALMDAARRGIAVTVLYDAVGSWSTPQEFFDRLRSSGAEVRGFKPLTWRRWRSLFRRDHRKLLLVDGAIAFVGGINVSAHWAPSDSGESWRDDVIQIEGPAVHGLERCFAVTWRALVRRKLAAWCHRLWQRRPPQARARGDVSLAILSNRRAIYRAYLHALEQARTSVMISAAYFMPHRRMLEALRAAAARGVKVHLVLNGKSDHPWLELISRALYRKLLEAGVQIYEWRVGTLHSKTAVIDGTWGTLGSFNLDRVSFAFNYETNVAFADPRLGAELEESFRQDVRRCRPVTLAQWRSRPLWRQVFEKLLCFV